MKWKAIKQVLRLYILSVLDAEVFGLFNSYLPICVYYFCLGASNYLSATWCHTLLCRLHTSCNMCVSN